MTIKMAYRTDNAEVLAWVDHINEEDRKFRERCKAFAETYLSDGSDSLYVRRNNWGSYVCAVPSYAPKDPDLWRSADGGKVPRKKDGDPEMFKAFNALIYGSREECPGMPKWFNGAHPGLAVFDGVVWVTWGGIHPKPDQGVVGEMWKAERPSLYYAAKEAHEDAEVTKEAQTA